MNEFYSPEFWDAAWGVQKGKNRLQDVCPAGGPPLKRSYSQGVERLGMAGPSDTLGSLRPPLAIHPWPWTDI
jgi:hypothetical protein